eukprot:4426516-Heterocapsa_arctica.AAC.1
MNLLLTSFKVAAQAEASATEARFVEVRLIRKSMKSLGHLSNGETCTGLASLTIAKPPDAPDDVAVEGVHSTCPSMPTNQPS